jgi:hypothetical protein
MPVVDAVLAPPAQPGHLLDALLGVEEFDPLGVQPGLQPLADQPAGHRVDVAFHPDGAAGLHPDPQPLARLQPAGRQRPQHGPLLGQAVLPAGVELGEQLLEEGGVGVAAGEVAAAAQQQGLVQGALEAVVPLLDVAVLVGLAGSDGLALKAVVAQQGLVASLEDLGLGPGLDGGGQAVGAVHLGDAAEFPEGVLEPLAEALVALGEADSAGLPVGVSEDEVVDQVGEGEASEGDAQVGAVGEVTGGQASGVVILGEEDLLGGPVLCPPAFDPALQGAELSIGEASGLLALQGQEEGLGLQGGVEGQLLLDPAPGFVKGVLACPPGVLHAYLAGQPLKPPVLACGLAVHAGLGRGQRQRHTLLQGQAQAEDLLVRDHRGSFPVRGSPMLSACSDTGEF